MKAKLIYTTLIGLLISTGASNAMDRKFLTDGNEQKTQLTTYQSGNSQLVESKDFSNASQIKFQVSREVSPGEFVQFDALIKHLGKDRYISGQFADYMEACALKWHKEMTLEPQKVIEILKQDDINIAQFKIFLIDILLRENPYNWDSPVNQVSEPFKTFHGQGTSPFSGSDNQYSNSYKMNCFMFSLPYYFGQNTQPVKIQSKESYNGLNFTILQCANDSQGTKMNFTFQSDDLRGKVKKMSDNAVSIPMSQSGSYNQYSAQYQVDVFKADESLYDIKVLLSLQKPSFGYGTPNPFVEQKITTIRLQVDTK